MNELSSQFLPLLKMYGFRILTAILILILGRWIAMFLRRFTVQMMKRSKVEQTVVSFLSNLIYYTLLVFVIIAALNRLGLQTTSFIAIIGAAGLAIGLALQGSLSNFAAGFLLIIFRPIRVGDYVDVAGVSGTVEKIEIFTTQLKTPDNKTVIIPNAKVTGDNIVNWSVKGTRRVDLTVGIGYDSDIDKAKEIITGILAQDARVLSDPPAVVAVGALGESSVDLIARPWVNSADYWNFYWETLEKIKKNFDAADISIPFPQRDVHLFEHRPE